jgi:hypothetical protein
LTVLTPFSRLRNEMHVEFNTTVDSSLV